jgi:hypothetical protein
MKSVPVRDMPEFSVGVIVDGQFAGEVILRNVAGWSSLTSHRYWPSAFMLKTRAAYVPDFNVQLMGVKPLVS